MQAQPIHQSMLSYAITIGFVLVMMALRLRRAGQVRRLHLGSLWIVPVLYLAVAVMMFITYPPTGWVAIACLLALGIGAAVGWQRGRMMHIEVDPATQTLRQKASPAAMMFLMVLIVVRMGARAMLAGNGGAGLSPAMLTDPLIAFALGMFTLQRLEMYLRARRLLEEARRV